MALGTGTMMLLGGGLALGGNILSGNAQKQAAQAQAQAALAAQQTQMEMFNQGMAATRPYREFGQQALGGLQSFMTPEGQMQMMDQYSQSPMFQQQLEAGSENVLRNQAATGALRTGQTDFALGSLPMQMQQQYMGDQFNRLSSMAGMGLGSAQQVLPSAIQTGANIGNMQMAQGQAQGQANAAMGNMFGQTMGQLGGLGMWAGARQGGLV
jgi:hypothetical protein